MENKSFAIIGLGFIAPRHIQAIQRIGGDIKWLCDIDSDKYDPIIQDLGYLPNFTTSWRNIDDVDYVVICTPNYLHIEMAHYFAEKGIEVLVEKPPAINTDYWPDDDRINVVLQLHHSPKVIEMKEKLGDDPAGHSGKIIVKVKRDQIYWEGWKGDESRSGGILFNLGVHYIELLQHLFGEEYRIGMSSYTPKKATGVIELGRNNVFQYHFEIMPDAEGQTRTLEVDGEEVELSNKDNLSYEDLHVEVYKDLLEGKGIKLSECKNTIKFIEELRRS